MPSCTVESIHRLVSKPLSRKVGAAAAGGTVLGLVAVGVSLRQEHRHGADKERSVQDRLSSQADTIKALQAKIRQLELVDEDKYVEEGMALIMSAEACSSYANDKRHARQKMLQRGAAKVGNQWGRGCGGTLFKDSKISELEERAYRLITTLSAQAEEAANNFKREQEEWEQLQKGNSDQQPQEVIINQKLAAAVVEGQLYTLQDHHKGDQVVIEAMEAQLLSAKAALQELEDSEDSHILRTLNLQRMKRTLPTTRRR
ncbi:hypothetical protein ABBQ38_000669 [Trebouxia sp. C0009 RCD-2024]